MRKYKEELVTRLQNDSKVATENGVDFIIKPIPEMEKISGMDPRMLKAAKEKIKKPHFLHPICLPFKQKDYSLNLLSCQRQPNAREKKHICGL